MVSSAEIWFGSAVPVAAARDRVSSKTRPAAVRLRAYDTSETNL